MVGLAATLGVAVSVSVAVAVSVAVGVGVGVALIQFTGHLTQIVVDV